MTTELIIAEKPKVAEKIAMAIGTAKKQSNNGVPYYTLKLKDKKIIVAAAAGHLYVLSSKEKEKKDYPIFNCDWEPIFKVNKEADYTKKYIDTIKKVAKEADEFTIATDYDIEGEIIGYNVLKYACKQKDAERMKYSAITKATLKKSYENKEKTLNWGQAHQGLARHFTDWFYGINLSRALTNSIKASKNKYMQMSSGRVQGPTLKVLTNREKEIDSFIPEKYWEVKINGNTHKTDLEFEHKEKKFKDKKQAEEVFKKVNKKNGIVTKVNRRKFQVKPPIPFDFTALQLEVNKVFKIPPKDTLKLAQDLYSNGWISYPRTSSQKYPKDLNFEEILTMLKRGPQFSKLAQKILSKKEFKPTEGKKDDPAHPAIYPTGILPDTGDARLLKVYDLIVKRFFAVFGEEATRETMTVIADFGGEEFNTKGTRTVEDGWYEFYKPHLKLEEITLPDIKEKEEIKNKKTTNEEKETKPPKRYTEASIISELEKNNIGTKQTRSVILQNLFQRKYLDSKSIVVTKLGQQIIQTLETYCPEILSFEMTRKLEKAMEDIYNNKLKYEDLLEEEKKILKKVLTHFKKSEKEIGAELYSAMIDTTNEKNRIGKCPVCNLGSLTTRKGKFGEFIACNDYPDCKTTLSIPAGKRVEATTEICEHDNYPIIKLFNKKGSKDEQKLCPNPACISKINEEEKNPEKDSIEGSTCNKCNKGTMIKRRGMYGEFYGCSNYPKCKNIVSGAKKRELSDEVLG